MSGKGTRRRRLGFNLGSRRCGAAAFAASFGRKPYGAAAAAHGGPSDRPLRFPPYPAAVPASITTRPTPTRHMRREHTETSQRPCQYAAHCPGWPLQRQGHLKIVSNRFAETIFRTHP